MAVNKVNPAIIEKLKKLLTLGFNNQNEHEAAASMRMAAKLAAKHGLSISDIDTETGEVGVNTEKILMSNKQNKAWEGMLLAAMCKCFNTHTILMKSFNNPDGEWKLFGTKSDIEISLWYFKYLRLRIIRQGKQKFKKINERKSYAIGAADTLYTRLIDYFVKSKKEFEDEKTTALIVVKNTAVRDALMKAHPKSKTMKSRKSKLDHTAYTQGAIDGKTMPLSRGHLN